MANLKKDLEEIGLADKEAAVYIASLELGQSPVQKIATQAEVKRATAYVIIESLINKGLMSSVEQGKKTYFVAEDPENLKRLIQKQKSKIDENEKKVVELIPELELLFKTTGERPIVRIFEGIEGIKTVREDFIKTKCNETLGILSLDELIRLFPNQENELTKKRIQKGVKSRIIYTHSNGPVKDATNEKMLREARFVPHNVLGSEGDITIYGDKVAIASLKGKPTGILIEHINITDFMKRVFELAWEGAQKYQNVKKT